MKRRQPIPFRHLCVLARALLQDDPTMPDSEWKARLTDQIIRSGFAYPEPHEQITRAMDAVEHAIESPLLETSLEGARSILLSVTGGRDLSLWEVNEAAKAVAEAAHPDANIIFGAMVDEKVVDQVWVTVVATGYSDQPLTRAQPQSGTRSARVPADTEPRVSRGTGLPRASEEFDVPEFVPRR